MTRPFILARTFAEAKEIAHLAGLQGLATWRYLSDVNARGHRGVPLLITEDHCWHAGRAFADIRRLDEVVQICDMKVTVVPCPPDWHDFQLPDGWNEPKTCPRSLAPAKTKASWWRGAVWTEAGQ